MNRKALRQVESINKNDWCTPPWLFQRLQEVFKFEVDGASNDTNALLPSYCTIQNPLQMQQVCFNKIFINPPFNNQEDFIAKSCYYTQKLGCLLLPFRPETKLWHKYIWPNATIFVFNKRIQYIHPETKQEVKGAAFPSCLVFYGDLNPFDLTKLSDLGIFIKGIRNG